MENISISNERQIGGEHYKSAFQHWDLVTMTSMPYLLGCATKYLARWRKKNGIQDLEKALHYVEKQMELMPNYNNGNSSHVGHSCFGATALAFISANGMPLSDHAAFILTATAQTSADLHNAISAIKILLAEARQEQESQKVIEEVVHVTKRSLSSGELAELALEYAVSQTHLTVPEIYRFIWDFSKGDWEKHEGFKQRIHEASCCGGH